jgi:RNA polymerase sigma-70 factor (ECF subfamily)
MCAMTSILPVSRGDSAWDEQLITALRGCASRDEASLRALYDLAAPRLLGQLVYMLGDPAEAEDALQECFVRIWQRAASFSTERGRPYTWLLSVARHHAIDRLRARRGTTPVDEVDEALLAAELATAGESSMTSAALHRCMCALDSQQQQCLRLAYITGRSPNEIAQQLQLPLSSVKSWIRGGLLALQECMQA